MPGTKGQVQHFRDQHGKNASGGTPRGEAAMNTSNNAFEPNRNTTQLAITARVWKVFIAT